MRKNWLWYWKLSVSVMSTILMSLIKTIVITTITACLVRLAAILEIMSVSIFKTVVIVYITRHRWETKFFIYVYILEHQQGLRPANLVKIRSPSSLVPTPFLCGCLGDLTTYHKGSCSGKLLNKIGADQSSGVLSTSKTDYASLVTLKCQIHQLKAVFMPRMR